MTDIRIKNLSDNPLPSYATALSAGVDLYANLQEEIILGSLERALVPTGIYLELPAGFEGQVRPRSGLAAKHGLSVLNSPGTIDADYRGELKVILVNLSNEAFTVKHGERIAQLVIAKHETANWIVSEELSSTVRGEGGFGHTGTR